MPIIRPSLQFYGIVLENPLQKNGNAAILKMNQIENEVFDPLASKKFDLLCLDIQSKKKW